jgi:hypothetical protein
MRSGALCAAAVSLAALGGCTSSAVPSTGPELLAVAVEALEEAGSVRIEGNVAYGDPYDVHVQRDGAVGKLGLGSDYDAPFVAVDGEAYLLPPDNYWPEAGVSEDDVARLRGRYVVMPEDGWRGDIPGSLADVTEHFFPAADDVTDDIGRTEIDGRDVLVLTSGDGTELAVDAEAPHRPFRLVIPADEQAMAEERELLFRDFGEGRRTIEAPDDPITAEELGG